MNNCPKCDASLGQLHHPGCGCERCPVKGHQLIGCGCSEEAIAAYGRMPWDGEWPGVRECREYGFWAVFGPSQKPPVTGWVPVPVGTPGASENLNRLVEQCRWDPLQRRWILLENPPPLTPNEPFPFPEIL